MWKASTTERLRLDTTKPSKEDNEAPTNNLCCLNSITGKILFTTKKVKPLVNFQSS